MPTTTMTTPHMPTSAQLAKVMQVVGNTPETAQYALGRIEEIFDDLRVSNLPEVQSMHQRWVAFVDNVHLNEKGLGDPWRGEPPRNSEFTIIQNALAKEAAAALKGLSTIDFNYQINKEGQLVRGYDTVGANGTKQHIDNPATLKSLDTLMNAYLADHNVITQNGTLIDANGDGQITWDERKKPEQGDPDYEQYVQERTQISQKVHSLMENGFADYLRKMGINVSGVNRAGMEVEEVGKTMDVDTNLSQNEESSMDVDNTRSNPH